MHHGSSYKARWLLLCIYILSYRNVIANGRYNFFFTTPEEGHIWTGGRSVSSHLSSSARVVKPNNWKLERLPSVATYTATFRPLHPS